jgi:hypothetical protein
MSACGEKPDHMIDIDHMGMMEANKPRLRQLYMEIPQASTYGQLGPVHAVYHGVTAICLQAQHLCWLEYRLPCRDGNAEALTTSRPSGSLPTRNIAPISTSLP